MIFPPFLLGAAAPAPATPPVVNPGDFDPWSSLSTWGGSFPAGRAPLTLTSGAAILYDINMADSDGPSRVVVGNGAKLYLDQNAASALRYVGGSIIVQDGGELWLGDKDTVYEPDITFDIAGDMPTVTGYDNTGHALYRGRDYNYDTPTGNDGYLNDGQGMNRAIMCMNGGKVSMAGRYAPLQGRLVATAAAGQNYVDLDIDVPTYMIGGTAFISPDGFYDPAKRTETKQITAVLNIGTNKTRVTFDSNLGFGRYGKIQYPTDNGISETPGSYTLRNFSDLNDNNMRSDAGQESAILYNRAVVGMIRPNIHINGYDYAGKTNLINKDGVHTMQEGLRSRWYMRNGIAIRKYGHFKLKGRYAIHQHQPSYNIDGTPTNDGSTYGNLNPAFGNTQYKCNYGPNESHYEGITCYEGFNRSNSTHAARGVKILNSIFKDAIGHCLFQENGSEEECTWSGNLVLSWTPANAGEGIQEHDESNASGLWLANPFNTITNNQMVDSPGSPWQNVHSFGIVSANRTLQYGCTGFSTAVPIAPGAAGRMGTWSNNNGLSYGLPCKTRGGQAYQDGRNADCSGNKVKITTDGLARQDGWTWNGDYYGNNSGLQNPQANQAPLVIDRMHLHKGPAYINVADNPQYTYPQQTDQLVTMWTGTTFPYQGSTILHPTCAYETNNHENHYLRNNKIMVCAMTSYHGTTKSEGGSFYDFDDPTDTIFEFGGANHGAVQGIGVMETWDLYLDPTTIFPIANPKQCLYKSRGCWQTPPSHLTQAVTTYDAITGTQFPGPKWVNYSQSSGDPHAWTLGVIFDRYGTVGQGSTNVKIPNSWIVFNQPYFTYGLSAGEMFTKPGNTQSIITTRNRYGISAVDLRDNFKPFGFDNTTPRGRYTADTKFQRTDTAGAIVANTEWEMPDIQTGLIGFHHCTVAEHGGTHVSWPIKGPIVQAFFFEIQCIPPASQVYDTYPYNNPNEPANAFFHVSFDCSMSTCHASVYRPLNPAADDPSYSVGETPGQAFNTATSLANLYAQTSGLWQYYDTTVTPHRMHLRLTPFSFSVTQVWIQA